MSCLRCGAESADVRMALVDLEAEAREDGEPLGKVTVAVPDERGPRYAEVPARYGHEPRCRDRVACRRRVVQAAQPDEQAAAEEVVPWL